MRYETILKANCSYLLLLFIPFSLMGQMPWMEEVKKNKKDANFYEVRQAFKDYWKGKVPEEKGKIPKAKGYKQFKRWEWFWEPRVGKDGIFPSPSVVAEELERYNASQPASPSITSPSPSISGGWNALGPSSSNGGYAGVGRLNCIAFHPTNASIFWVGSPAGGLWKTTTGGNSWTTLTDNLPVMGVSAIIVTPSDPNQMYIATGDRDHGDTYSVGVLKSTNGGASWTTTGLSYTVLQGTLIKGLIMHPTNPLILLAATSSGIYRTTNGGTSWTLEQTGDFQEILFKPGDPTIVYACTIGNAQIFRSINSGDTWSQATSFTGIYRIAMAVTAANSSIVGALCSNNTNNGFGGYYSSTNSGVSFGLKYGTTGVNLLGYDVNGGDAGGQGWYDLCLAISPINANEIYAGGVNTWKSTNGGSSWTINTMWYGGTGVPEVHADKHWMTYSPLNSSALYQCNDGGVYLTTNGGASWSDLSNGLQTTQFYRMGNSATNANLTIAGTQDNGTKIRNGVSYKDVIGGDGMESIIDYSNANVMYGELYYGDIYKSTDGGVNFFGIAGSLPSGGWVTPYVIDPVNPQVLYAGVSGNVWKTSNGGTSWGAISSSLSPNEIQSLAVAPSNTQTIYAGSYYNLYKTTNGGSSWSPITLPSFEAVTYIEVHPTNSQVLWITFSGYSSGAKVYRSDNGGASWVNISGTLPNLPTNTIEYDKNTGVLYVGNDAGVFVRTPSMSDWQKYDLGLPNVVVTELEIQYSSGRLRAATFGRGLWESDLYSSNYCIPIYTVGCGSGDFINNFSFNTLVNNGSGCTNTSGTAYTNYAATGTFTTSVNRTLTYALKLQSGSTRSQGFGVWIDYNNDKEFDDAGEFVYASSTASASQFTANVTIPATATLGALRMRVRSRFNGTFASNEFCTALSNGEAEDYTITILSAPPTITTFLPTSGPSGVGVMVKGTNFTNVSAVRFNGLAATETYVASSTLLYAKVPTGATTGKIQVVANSATGTSAASFTVAAIVTKWVAKTSLATPRVQHGSIATNGKVYAFGGYNSSGNVNSLVSYTPSTNSWAAGASLPVAIRGMAAALGSNGSIYMFGGANSVNTVATAYRYTPSTNTWATIASMPVAVFEAAAAATSSGKIYVFGGEPITAKGTSTNATRIYTISTNTWSSGANMPVGVQQHSAVTGADGKIYVIGGRALSAKEPLGLVQIYNPVTNTWTSGAAMLIPKVQFGAALGNDGKIYVIGGKANEPNYSGPFFHTTEVYTPSTNSWAVGPVLPIQVGQQTAVNLNGNLYALGGTNSSSAGSFNYQLILAPAAPSTLTATAASSSQINLKWKDNSLNETGFVIERAASSAGTYTAIASVGANVIAYSNTGLSASTTYYYRVKATNTAGSSAYSNVSSTITASSITSSIVEGSNNIEESVTNSLSIYPNPARTSMRVSFTVAEDQRVQLSIYDLKGSIIKQLYKGTAEAGKAYQFNWNASFQTPGVYICRFTTEQGLLTEKIILLPQQ